MQILNNSICKGKYLWKMLEAKEEKNTAKPFGHSKKLRYIKRISTDIFTPSWWQSRLSRLFAQVCYMSSEQRQTGGGWESFESVLGYQNPVCLLIFSLGCFAWEQRLWSCGGELHLQRLLLCSMCVPWLKKEEALSSLGPFCPIVSCLHSYPPA